MPSFSIGAELTDRFEGDGVQSDLTRAYGHRLRELDLTVDTSTTGSTALTLTITAADLWTAVLSCMALFDHGRYDITRLRAELTG
jgi:hypothetical protein